MAAQRRSPTVAPCFFPTLVKASSLLHRRVLKKSANGLATPGTAARPPRNHSISHPQPAPTCRRQAVFHQPRRAAGSWLALAALATACTSVNLPLNASESTKITVDVGQLLGPLAGVPAVADGSKDITTPPVPIDLRKSQPELAKYANGHIKTIEITAIQVTPTTNTLSGDLPPLDLYFGPSNATSLAQGVKVATIPAIVHGSTAAMSAAIDAAGMKTAGTQYLATLGFTQAMKATFATKAGQPLPTGKVDLNLVLNIQAVVSPL